MPDPARDALAEALERIWPALDRGASEDARIEACEAMDDLEALAALRAGSGEVCETCGGRGEVAATPGQPGDGPMPCPTCGRAGSGDSEPLAAELARERERAETAETLLDDLDADRIWPSVADEWLSQRFHQVSDELARVVAETDTLREAASDALSWIENYPLNNGREYEDDWFALKDALVAALAVSSTATDAPSARASQVAAFAALMLRELEANGRKDSHPLSHVPDHLLGQLREHVDKLAQEPTDEHAADVANLAMLYLAAT